MHTWFIIMIFFIVCFFFPMEKTVKARERGAGRDQTESLSRSPASLVWFIHPGPAAGVCESALVGLRMAALTYVSSVLHTRCA